MRSKYRKLVTEPNHEELLLFDNSLRFNSTINEFKDINIKKIFIKKQLNLNNDKNNIKNEKEKKIPSNTSNNDLKLYKSSQVRKNFYPQSKDLLSPEFKNIIQKMKVITEKASFSNFKNKFNKILRNTSKIDKKNIKRNEYNKNNILNTIQVRKKNIDIINKDENNNYISKFNQTMKNNDNVIFNYIKKKAIYHGNNKNIINKTKQIKNNENKTFGNLKLTDDKIEYKVDKNAENINHSSKLIQYEANSKLIPSNIKLKNKFLLFRPKKDEKIIVNSKKTVEIKKRDRNFNNTDIMNNNYQITDATITRENIMNTDNSNNNIVKTINEKNKENNKEKEKRRYIYINRKIHNLKNNNKTDQNNILKEKENNLKLSNKPNKIIEIEVENGNSIKSPSNLKKDINNSRYSLTEKKETFKKINDYKNRINSNFKNRFYFRPYKTKTLQNNVNSFGSLKYLVHKAHKIEELGDSFGNFYLSANSARNLQYKTKTHNLKNDERNINNYIKLKTLSDFGDISKIIKKNKYFKKDIFSDLISEEKRNFRKYSNFNNYEKDRIEPENKIINNNTFNTTVNFYKINRIPSDIKINTINEKNSILSKNNQKDIFKLEHKRASSDYSSYSNLLENFTIKTQKALNKEGNSENKEKDITLFKTVQYINNNNVKEENQNKEYEIDLEILYILEAKLKCILNKVNNYNICYNECLDWINYYFSCNFFEKEINLFKLNHNKNNIIYYIKVELLCYFLCYDVSFNKNYNQAGILLKTIFNLLHINFLIIISFIIFGNNKILEENNDNFCLNKLKEIMNRELKIKLTPQDINENSILLLISNNFKEISNYYKMIIDNLYSYYYSINDNINKSINKFPNCLKLDIKSLKNIQKLNIISLFFFDVYRLSNNNNFEDLKKFFELYLDKSKENESLIPYDNIIIKNNNSNLFNNNNYYKNNEINNYNYNKYILNAQKNYNNTKLNEYYLPPIKSQYKYTLVLDLDETLVYFQKENNSFNTSYNNNPILMLRPGLLDFLYKMKPLYELVLFSFGTKEYVDYILSIIEKKEKIFEYVLYRQHATYEKGVYVKNLSLLGRDLKRIIIVDNIPHVFKLQKSNGICIKSFYGDVISDRNTLKFLSKILEKIRFDADENEGDIRKSLKKYRNIIFTYITTNFEN